LFRVLKIQLAKVVKFWITPKCRSEQANQKKHKKIQRGNKSFHPA
jgi:hypothetical protein